jgi:choline dehydrogenase
MIWESSNVVKIYHFSIVDFPIVDFPISVKTMPKCKTKTQSCCVDYVIVGLGTAGSVLARYLSEPNPTTGVFETSVLVFEAGINRSTDPIVIAGPNDLLATQPPLTLDPKYALTQTINETGSNSDFILFANYSAGRMWFGGSAHNGLIAVRGAGNVYDFYAEVSGNPIWAYNAGSGPIVPFMKFLETFNPNDGTPINPQRGTTGPLQVTQSPPGILPSTDPFIQAIERSVPDLKVIPDYNISPQGDIGISSQQYYSDKTLQFRSFGLNFLPPDILSPQGFGLNGRKLQVISGAHVNKILFKPGTTQAIGVKFTNANGTSQKVYVNKEVILCAGCPISASILQRSGIGSAATITTPTGETYPGLNDLGIPVVVDNPNVGKGLKNHYGVIAAMTGSFNPDLGFLVTTFQDGSPYYPPAGVTGDHIRRINMEFFGSLLLPDEILTSLNEPPPLTPGISALVALIQPKNVGTSYIVDKSPFTLSQMRLNPYSDGGLDDPGSDLNLSVASYKIINAVAKNLGSTMIFPPPSHFTGSEAEVNAKLARDAKAVLASAAYIVPYHYTGTCNMSTSIDTGVVNGFLQVFGTTNLRVADNSIYPQTESGNTAWEAYLAGLICAHFLRPDLNLTA